MKTLKEALISKDKRDWASARKESLWILLPYKPESNIFLYNNYSDYTAEIIYNQTLDTIVAYVLTGKQVYEIFTKFNGEDIEFYGWEKGDKDGDIFTQESLISALKGCKYTGNGNSLPGCPKYFLKEKVLNIVKKSN